MQEAVFSLKMIKTVPINSHYPLVTICVPAYNAGHTLRQTLDSILAQDYPNFEVIVCDNLSTDNTAEIAKEYAERGVRYFLNPVHAEWGENNWNYTLSLASGPLIALYHADDLYMQTMVRRQAEFLQVHPEVSSVFTMTQMIDEQNRPIRKGGTHLPNEFKGKSIFAFPELFNAVLKYGNMMIVPTMMTRRTTIDAIGHFNYNQFYSASDLDLYFRMARLGPIGIIDEPLHRYRISPQQGSAQINKSRTYLAHFFQVVNYYLTLTEVRKLINQEALKMYRMYRSADQVFCAMNLALQGRTNEACILLNEAINWSTFSPAYHRPLQFVKLTFGAILLAALWMGIGKTIAQCGDIAYHRYRGMMCNPIK